MVHLASDADFDLRKLLPAPTNTEEDAGPYITMGLCYASDPQTHESDITIHRLCVQSRDELSMWLTPGRHIDAFRMKAEAAGQPLPISISIGVDPAIEIAACFEPPTTPLGFNELSIAGALRGRAVEMVQCKTINEKPLPTPKSLSKANCCRTCAYARSEHPYRPRNAGVPGLYR